MSSDIRVQTTRHSLTLGSEPAISLDVMPDAVRRKPRSISGSQALSVCVSVSVSLCVCLTVMAVVALVLLVIHNHYVTTWLSTGPISCNDRRLVLVLLSPCKLSTDNILMNLIILYEHPTRFISPNSPVFRSVLYDCVHRVTEHC